jgi:putative ABC transport system substrate-binding protein
MRATLILVLVLLLGLAIFLAPRATEAQPTGKTHGIVIAHPSTPVAEMTDSTNRYYKALFSECQLGYAEGQNLMVERRSAEGRTERFPEFAREVVQLRPDVILAASSRLIHHLKAATAIILIVGITGESVAAGIVRSLARPGGNVTGFAATPGDEILRQAPRIATRGRARELARGLSRSAGVVGGTGRSGDARGSTATRAGARRGSAK